MAPSNPIRRHRIWRALLGLTLLPGMGWAVLAAETAPKAEGPADADAALLRDIGRYQFGGDLPRQFDRAEFKQLRDRLRQRFPVESLTERLAYEAASQDRRAEERKDHAADNGFIDQLEQPALGLRPPLGRGFGFGDGQERGRALLKLHQESVRDFAETAGFGAARMPSFTPRGLFIEVRPIEFQRGPSLSADEEGRPITLPKEGGVQAGPAPHWPSVPSLDEFHLRNHLAFAAGASFGSVKDKDHVIGFVPHAFRELPVLLHPRLPVEIQPNPERWLVQRLELVSLLKEEKPAVYMTEHLPDMHQLTEAQRRPLGRFEQTGLARLRKGEHLVVEATTNRLTMLGAVRAAKQCLQCHEVERGDLLGAFSYDLQRDPPARVAVER